MSYTKTEFIKFITIRDRCSAIGFDNYDRNIARLDMTEFLKKFDKKDQDKMFEEDNKRHGIKN